MQMMLYFLFLIVTIQLLPSQALAIINAEDLDLVIDGDGVAGKAGFSLSGSSGNSDKVRGEANGHVIWQHGQHREMLVGSISYGNSRGVRDTNKSFVHLRHRYDWNETWALEAFAQAQQDEFARLKLRTLLGGGLRWSFKSQQLEWHVGLGSFFEHEALRAAAGIAPVSQLWRGNSYLSVRYVINERIRLQNTVYYQPAWRALSDYRLLDDAALHVALSDRLDLKIVIEMAQDSRPPAGVKHIDTSYKTGLSFRF
ncbi:MAG: DUF481 domain-containing protein [Mariprofundus sp.]|nr:DUF481 domain-containing protein [Mariprofundus sp.]